MKFSSVNKQMLAYKFTEKGLYSRRFAWFNLTFYKKYFHQHLPERYEFAKLRAFAFEPYVSYVPRDFRVSRAFVPSLLTCLTHASYLRALRALFVLVKILLGWIYSPSKFSIFQRLYQRNHKLRRFKRVKKQPWKTSGGEVV